MQSFLDPEKEQIRDEANAWVARFAPLVMNDEVPTEQQVKERIEACIRLSQEAEGLRERLAAISDTEPDLISTFERALGQLDSIESDFRKQLGRLKPGDPQGIADLESINDKLAERLARQEIGADTVQDVSDVLEMKVSPGNKAAAIGLGIFGLGWNAFTAVHAIFMIGGMWKAFGPFALALLAFYAIFFFAGFAMWTSAVNMGSTENIRLDGRTLTVRKQLGPFTKEKQYSLAPKEVAEISEMEIARVSNSENAKKPTPVVLLHDADGNPITLGVTATDVQRRQTRDKINAYLKLKG